MDDASTPFRPVLLGREVGRTDVHAACGWMSCLEGPPTGRCESRRGKGFLEGLGWKGEKVRIDSKQERSRR